MRSLASLTLTAALAACGADEIPNPPAELERDRTARLIEPALDRALFYAREVATGVEHELRVAKMTAAIDVGEATIHTRLAVELTNTSAAQVEAVMRIPVPPGAAISGAILEVGTRSMEGVFIARERARAIYDRIVSGRRDPLLVAWHDGEWVDAHIFPVNAGETRRFELEWYEPIAYANGEALYRVPLLAHRGRLLARPATIDLTGHPIAVGPYPAIVLSAGEPPALATARLFGDPFALLLARGIKEVAQTPKVVIVVETSMKMNARLRWHQRATLIDVIAALPADARVSLIAGDWTAAYLAEDATRDVALAALDRLDAHPSAGALDLARTLELAARHAAKIGARQVVYIGMGEDAFEYRDPLGATLEQLRIAGAALYAISPRGEPLAAALRDATWISGGRPAAEDGYRQVLEELDTRVMRSRPELGGVDHWYALRTVTGEVVWSARFGGLDVAFAGAKKVDARPLEALWARAAVRPRAGERDPGERHRVLTSLTSILALESDADYTRWGLDGERRDQDYRRVSRDTAANAGLLGLLRGTAHGGAVSNVFGPGGLGIGSLGTNSLGSSSLGINGLGDLDFGGRGKSPIRLVPDRLAIMGAMDKEVVRRFLNRSLSRYRYCYEKELAKNPELEGKIGFTFTIDAGGEAINASIYESTINDGNVERCVVHVTNTLKFPRPRGGGMVIVKYPLHFSYSDDTPKSPWVLAAELSPARGARVEKIAELLGAPRHLEREALAWWLIEHRLRVEGTSFPACRLIAQLLLESEHALHAERILSEAINLGGLAVETELRQIGREEAAGRVHDLTQRLGRY